ncbi:hypothetical protein HaLaN_20574 [Haematococcus lacustris]|uniref:Uncharacterized protein n=1 Tax=Haematococcus lacustris TaxID=44745 RepID=A0A699ZWB9_HAELA|nr:hypothetical protein HaLaN_20574 [Haematococcus lacustris]
MELLWRDYFRSAAPPRRIHCMLADSTSTRLINYELDYLNVSVHRVYEYVCCSSADRRMS